MYLLLQEEANRVGVLTTEPSCMIPGLETAGHTGCAEGTPGAFLIGGDYLPIYIPVASVGASIRGSAEPGLGVRQEQELRTELRRGPGQGRSGSWLPFLWAPLAPLVQLGIQGAGCGKSVGKQKMTFLDTFPLSRVTHSL